MAAFTYPGVYIEEISSGQHTITGVATSIAAFVGWTNQGPVGNPTMVESWSEYQTLFGGFLPGNLLGYAVYQFFANGGSQAYIVRLVDGAAATAGSIIGGLQLYANNPGAWANGVTVAISNVTTNSAGTDTTFNLQVANAKGQTLESYTNLSVSSTSPGFAVTIVDNDSSYISFIPPGGTAPVALPMYSVPGSVTTPTFLAGETVQQATTLVTATVIGTVTGSTMMLGPISGVADGTDLWTGLTSAAVFKPTGTPTGVVHAAAATALNAGTSPTSGTDGAVLVPNTAAFHTALAGADGYQLLANVPIFNLLCVPGENDAGQVPNMIDFCHTYRAFMIVDAAQTATVTTLGAGPKDHGGTAYTLNNPSYGGFYFPWIQAPDPAAGFRPMLFPPSGFVAGEFAATDANRGVWKAPAGIDATLAGSLGLQIVLNDTQNGDLNPFAVNCLRQFPVYGNVVWGARTMDGADARGSEWKYIPIRRLAMFLESSLYRGTQWVVFEPNSEPLWGQIRLSVGTFLQELFLKGAFAGTTPQQAYFVKCDSENNPDASIALGIVNIMVGFAPLNPAEFVVIQITQMLNS
jgi:hypothetical protein